MVVRTIVLSALAWLLAFDSARADDIATQIQVLLQVEKEGVGHAAAIPALKSLEQLPASALVPLLQGMDNANPLAANWFRGAFEAVADRELKAGLLLPATDLEQFALDRSHASQSRQLAFDWLVRVDASATDRLIPGMIDDPSAEFRRLAVQRLIDAAGKADEALRKQLHRQVFEAALDPDQLDLAFNELSKVGEKPDLKRRLGLLSDWWIIGPFDHRGGIGFDAVYPPETEVDLQQEVAGTDRKVSWLKKQSDDRHGTMDLNKLISPEHGAVAYAYREFEIDRELPVDIRIGTANGFKLWVNGELLFAHEEYHQSMRIDQYRAQAQLRSGTNRLLLKICQNEQTEDWAQRWGFQLRVCDSTGTAVLPLNEE
jgi:hypothetical protein